MFNKGDLVVYPAHGIGRIEDVQVKCIDGEDRCFYILRIIENDMKIMVPIGNIKTVGIRPLIGKDEVPKIFEVLEKREMPSSPVPWNKRYREYMEKIKSGSIFEIAEVFRDLNLIQSDKHLSFGERKMLEVARTLMVKELSIVMGLSEDEVDNMLRSFFG